MDTNYFPDIYCVGAGLMGVVQGHAGAPCPRRREGHPQVLLLLTLHLRAWSGRLLAPGGAAPLRCGEQGGLQRIFTWSVLPLTLNAFVGL